MVLVVLTMQLALQFEPNGKPKIKFLMLEEKFSIVFLGGSL